MYPHLIDTARGIAQKAHTGHFDKIGAPYIQHPAMVADLVQRLPDPAEARRTALSMIASEYATDSERFARYVVAGTAEQVADQLADYAEAGAEHLHVHLAHPDPQKQLDLWGSNVLPLLVQQSSRQET